MSLETNNLTQEKKKSPEERESAEDFEIIDSAGERVMIETGIIKLCEKINKGNYDKLFFLDKSARPLAWVLYEVIKAGKVDLELSDIKFINPPEDTDSSPSFEQEQKFFKTWSDYIKSGDNICLVDELRSTGGSYQFIKDLIYSTLDKVEIEVDIDDFDVMSAWPSWHSSTEDIGIKEKDEGGILTARNEVRDDTLRKECKNIGKRAVKHFNKVVNELNTTYREKHFNILKKMGISPKEKFSSRMINISRDELHNKIKKGEISKKESFILINLFLDFRTRFAEGVVLSEDGSYKERTGIFVDKHDKVLQYLSQQAENWLLED